MAVSTVAALAFTLGYSGCGAGGVVGVVLARGVPALSVGWVATVTFGFAYLFGHALTIGPLMHDASASKRRRGTRP